MSQFDKHIFQTGWNHQLINWWLFALFDQIVSNDLSHSIHVLYIYLHLP